MNSLLEKVRSFLDRNNFYAYRKDWKNLGDGFDKEFAEVGGLKNKRNLLFDRRWSSIKDLGEDRELLVMELGGSYLLIYLVLVENGKVRVAKSNKVDFYENDLVYTPELLFEKIGGHLDRFLSDEEKGKVEDVVFVFTFPLEQLMRDDGKVDVICNYFGKTRKSEGIVGLQVGVAMQNYFRQKGYPKMTVSVTNDVPVCLLAAKIVELELGRKFDGVLNLIVGTGTNLGFGCDLEAERSDKMFIVNSEYGNFKSVRLSEFDKKMDQSLSESEKGMYLTEKMISGAWLHLLFKVMVSELIDEGLVLVDEIKGFDFENMDSGQIEGFWKSNVPSNESLFVLNWVWKEIGNRAGAICGLLMARVMRRLYMQIGRSDLKIAIVETGGVVVNSHEFRNSMLMGLDIEMNYLGLSDLMNYELFSPVNQGALGAVAFDELMKDFGR